MAAENACNEQVARVENHIIARLRDRLGLSRNANEMFVWPMVRGSRIISRVTDAHFDG